MKKSEMSMYHLWFKYGAKHKMNIVLLTYLLGKAGMIEILEVRGEKRCKLKETSEKAIYHELWQYSQLPIWSQLYLYYQAAKAWKRKMQQEPLARV